MTDLVKLQVEQLTNRELQTLLLMSEGLSDREVADRLAIGRATAPHACCSCPEQAQRG